MPRDLLAQPTPKAPRDLLSAQPRYQSSFLPFEVNAQGGVDFNSDLGIVGAVKRAVMAPRRAMTGEMPMIDPQTGRTSDDAIGRAADIALTFNPTPAPMRAGEGIFAAPMTRRAQPPMVPPSEAIRKAAVNQFDEARNINPRYKQGVGKGLGELFLSKLDEKGLDDSNAKAIVDSLVKRLKSQEGEITYKDLMSLKNTLTEARMEVKNDGSPTANAKAAKWVLDRLYKFIESPDPRVLAPGQSMDDAVRTASLHKDARGNYAAARRSETITGKLNNAELQAKIANSGMNTDNRIRALAGQFLMENAQGGKLRKGMTQEELNAVRAVAEGTATRNQIRWWGNFLGGGGGLGAGVMGGMAGYAGGLLGPVGGVALGVGVPATGYGLKSLGGTMSKSAMKSADTLMRSRSPLAQQMLLDAPMAPLPSPALPSLLMRGGMAATPSALDLLLSRQDRR
jgi:hypothetical protein